MVFAHHSHHVKSNQTQPRHDALRLQQAQVEEFMRMGKLQNDPTAELMYLEPPGQPTRKEPGREEKCVGDRTSIKAAPIHLYSL